MSEHFNDFFVKALKLKVYCSFLLIVELIQGKENQFYVIVRDADRLMMTRIQS